MVKAYKWVHASSKTYIPHNAVTGGKDSDGSEIFVGRTHYAGDDLPVKYIPSKEAAYVSYNGEEIGVDDFEVGIFKFYLITFNLNF